VTATSTDREEHTACRERHVRRHFRCGETTYIYPWLLSLPAEERHHGGRLVFHVTGPARSSLLPGPWIRGRDETHDHGPLLIRPRDLYHQPGTCEQCAVDLAARYEADHAAVLDCTATGEDPTTLRFTTHWRGHIINSYDQPSMRRIRCEGVGA
jgi:hypothetical protein